MTEPLDLDAIRVRADAARSLHAHLSDIAASAVDVPALLAEVGRLTVELATMTGYRDATQVEYDAMRADRDACRTVLRTLRYRESVEAERDAMRPVVEAAMAWHEAPAEAMAWIEPRLRKAVDAYAAGQVEVPPTPTTDAEIEALPRLDLGEWKATVQRLVDLATVTGYLWTDPGSGQEHMLAPEDVAVVVRAAQNAASGRTGPAEGEETHQAAPDAPRGAETVAAPLAVACELCGLLPGRYPDTEDGLRGAELRRHMHKFDCSGQTVVGPERVETPSGDADA